MFARFFIDRPIFAWVISIVIVLAGLAAAVTLPIAQYPEITPPSVQVSATYPGANAKDVADTIAAPIEQQVNGVEKMLYMSSVSANDGSYNLTVTFELGTDLNMAQVLVQNRVQLATAQLPVEVQRQGLTIKKKSPNILLVVSLYSPDGSHTQLELSNYATIQLKDEIARLDGVGDVNLFGEQDYSMRAWLDPDKLNSFKLTTTDVVNAIQAQNVQVAAGQIGQEPAPKGQALQLTLSTEGRLTTAEQFGKIVVKAGQTNSDGTLGAAVTLDQVARVVLGAQNMNQQNTLDGGPAIGISIYQLPGSNALDVADRVKAKMEALSKRFPDGIKYAIRYDTTPFITQSIEEVFHTLRDAIILVAIVVLLFLQDWRAVILPMIDVPVSLTGTFAVMLLFGFSLNNLTLFGLVLAIGIVVDDAIVVLENIETWIAKGFDPRSATIRAMDEVTGPIIAITLVLSSVFLPSALLPGITGEFFRQFALTIAAAMVISATNAMTMTPARAVAIFAARERHAHKQGAAGGHGHGTEALPWWGICALLGWLSVTVLDRFFHHPAGWTGYALLAAYAVPGVVVGWFAADRINALLAWVFKWFNKGFDVVTRVYGRTIAGFLRLALIVLLVYGGLIGLTAWGLTHTPVGFVPMQDKGYLVVSMQLPDAASLQRSSAVMARVEKICRDEKGVGHTIGIGGYSLLLSANGSNYASMFVVLEDFDVRKDDPEKNGFAILFRLQDKLRREIQDAAVLVLPPPPVDGLGTAGGFKIMVQDRGSMGYGELDHETLEMVRNAQKKKESIANASTQFKAAIPQLYADIDRTRCIQMGVNISDVFDTLQSYIGSTFVNNFNLFGRTWQVNVQADAPYRASAEYVKNLRVKNIKGEMVPLGSVATIRDATGPAFVQRYNMYPAAAINGSLAPGTSSGDGIRIIDTVAKDTLPQQMTTEWTELFYLQLLEGDSAIWAFVGAVVLVYLILAAMYESWTMPAAIILVMPMCILSAIVGVRAAGVDINIFVQIGFVVLVGLAAKNAILIVEFVNQKRAAGEPLRAAVIDASVARLRPIVMTSVAFILGVVPLVLAKGAGAEMRATLGVAVFSGMLGVTFFGVMLTPVFAYVIGRWKPDAPPPAATEPAPAAPPPAPTGGTGDAPHSA